MLQAARWPAKYAAVLAATEGKSLEAFEEERRRQIDEHGTPSRYAGPSARQIQLYLLMMRWRDRLVNAFIGLHNGLVGTLTGWKLSYAQTTAPPNAPRMMDILMRVHGTQLLVESVRAPSNPQRAWGRASTDLHACAPRWSQWLLQRRHARWQVSGQRLKSNLGPVPAHISLTSRGPLMSLQWHDALRERGRPLRP